MIAAITEDNLSGLLSKDECLQIVKNDLRETTTDVENGLKTLNILKYNIEKCSNDLIGFMGNYLRLTIQLNSNNCLCHKQYFIKCVPLFNAYHRAECENKEFFRKECSIYKNILPNLQKYTHLSLFPKCYYTRKDLLVLEDLTYTQKYIHHLKLPYTDKSINIVLKSLAEMHAASMAWEYHEAVSIQKQFGKDLFELQLIASNPWFIASIKGIIFLAEIHPKYQYEAAQAFIQNKLYDILINMQQFTEPHHQLQNVFCHRDCWTSNIFFVYEHDDDDAEPIACRFIDFQQSRYAPPALDVLYFLYNSLIELNDKKNAAIEKYLNIYYDYLQHSMNNMKIPLTQLTKKHFKVDCDRAMLPTLVLACICEPLMKLPNGWSQTIRCTESATFDRYMNVDRTEMFMRVAKSYPNYMTIILKPIQELMEYFDYRTVY